VADEGIGEGVREVDPESYYTRGRFLCMRRKWQAGVTQLRLAADAGHTEAAFELGWQYIELDNPEKAAVWFKRAADAGHLEAAFRAGLAYARMADLDSAVHWWGVAAAQGHSEAAYYLRTIGI
jgi:TPR repeat protein